MRISDWSSDVCASDLYLGRFEERSPFVLLCAKDIDANDPARKCTAAIPGSYTHIFQRKGNSGPMEASAVGMAKTLWPSEIADPQLDALRFVPLSLRISIPRSEERRVGKEGVMTCKFRWAPIH